jgi:UDP-3-O-[3-hydroxymyristoyl] glucosamine N-acyltransferase
MNFPEPVSIAWIANLIDATIVGNPDALAKGINELHKVEQGDLAFVDHPKYYQTCINSVASFIIIDKPVAETQGKTLLVCAQPFEAYLSIVRHFRPFMPLVQSISHSATIGAGTFVMPGAVIGNHVSIGSHCVIYPNVVVYDYTVIGNNVTLHSGAVIGADAFYYNTKKTRPSWFKKMESCGRVIIEDDVEIGANTCIDKGVTHDTRIGRGTKIDNLVQIGHDVVVGSNCIIAAQVGVAGATTIGNGVTLWGQVGVSKTLSIGDNVQIYGQSGVAASLEGNKQYMGTPAIEAGLKRRELVWTTRIAELWQRLQVVEQKQP